MRVIGTAGHIDHGKSTLVRRLTGIDPDRLAEEKDRAMTIDLGFAWLTLPDETTIGVVDVPGHRDFIENMLAGVGGIDAGMLVIAADEGIMPQTREHLAILDLLGIPAGLIALTKIDLIDDPEWLDLVEAEVSDAVQHTILHNAPIVRVSAKTGAGLPDLLQALTVLLTDLPPRMDARQPRLPVDRVFTISGFGTVVTGTLAGGTLQVGDDVELQPRGLRGRIRNLQSYKEDVDIALPGSRVAVNISHIDKDDIKRGDVLTYPGLIRPTLTVDAYYRHLPDATFPLKHNMEVKFFSGAAETMATVRLLDADTIAPGGNGWLQLRLRDPIPLSSHERFILRLPSPPQTLGGGLVVNANPAQRWKRFQDEVLHDLQMRLEGTPAERLAQAAQGQQSHSRAALQQTLGYDDATLDQAIDEALMQRLVVQFDDGTLLETASYDALVQRVFDTLHAFHADEPLRLGMQREELRSRLKLKAAFFNQLVDKQTGIISEGALLRLATHHIQLSTAQQHAADTLLQAMNDNPYAPPTYNDAVKIAGDERILHALVDLGELVYIPPDIVFTQAAYGQMVAQILAFIDDHGQIDAKQVRDMFGSSRRYAIGLLEYLDSQHITKRTGDVRVRGKASQTT